MQPSSIQPGSFANQSGQPGGRSLTELTRRKNWPAKGVEGLKDLLQILDADGKLTYVSPVVTALTGYTPEDILGVHLKDLVHPDDIHLLVSELNESISTGKPLRMFYRFKKKDGTYGIFEAVGH